MLRIVARHLGVPENVLTVEPYSMPAVMSPSDVCVRMLASPINPSDRLTIGGAYSQRTTLPFVPGFEGIGMVESLGAGCHRFRAGQRVLPLGSAGGWQTRKLLPAEWCVRVPDTLTDHQAALSYINPLTAHLIMRELRPLPGARVGVNAAGSAIGRMFIRMINAAGALPVAIVRNSHTQDLLADEPFFTILREDEPLPALDGGLDAVGGASGRALAVAIKPHGSFYHYGLLSGVPLMLPDTERPMLMRHFNLRTWVHTATRDQLHFAMNEVFANILSGVAATHVEAAYPLAEVHAALTHDSRMARRGKILLIPN